MHDEPIVRLTPRAEMDAESRQWLRACEDIVNRALNVTVREEFELAQSELRELLVRACTEGEPANLAEQQAAIVERFTDRMRDSLNSAPS